MLEIYYDAYGGVVSAILVASAFSALSKSSA